MPIIKPSNQVKLTNVAIVKMKVKGKRFEIACYKNKVMDWRKGNEKDLDEVLQIEQVFKNVSKGVLANGKDLQRCFSKDGEDVDVVEICKIILKKGQLQVSQKEREHEQEAKLKDIATIIATMCINTETSRPYPVNMIEGAMKEVHFNVNPQKPAKKQALELISVLKETMPIERAQMRLRLEIPSKSGKDVKKAVEPLVAKIEEEDWGANYEMIVVIDPGRYRQVEEAVGSLTKGRGRTEVLDMKANVEKEGEKY